MRRPAKRFRVSFRKNGKQTRSVLYRRWLGMLDRCRGYGTKSPWLYAKCQIHWKSFADFRTWALANGFSKENCSPERNDPEGNYSPDNVIWVTVDQNRLSSRGSGYYADRYSRLEEDDDEELGAYNDLPPPEKDVLPHIPF